MYRTMNRWQEQKKNLWELNSFRILGSVQTQQLPTLLRQQCWKLLRACWQWCANGCNNSQQCWYLGRIQPISLCKRCVMSVRGPNIVGRVGSCWLKSLSGFKLCATTRNRVCKRTQHVTSNNVGSCWPTMLRPFARCFKPFFYSQAIFKAADHVTENVLNFLDNCLANYNSF